MNNTNSSTNESNQTLPGIESNIFSFISNNFTLLPKSAQILSYFVMLFLFTHIVVSQINGSTYIHGMIIPAGDIGNNNQELDIRFQDTNYGTNTDGRFILPIDFTYYYSLAAQNLIKDLKIPLEIYYKNSRLYCFEAELVTLKRLTDIQIANIEGEIETGCEVHTLGTSSLPGSSFINQADASNEPAVVNRLFINNLVFKNDIDQLHIRIKSLNYESPIYSMTNGNRIASNANRLKKTYKNAYFKVPVINQSTEAEIIISYQSGYFITQDVTETIKFTLTKDFGKITLNKKAKTFIRGGLHLANQYDVKIFEKEDMYSNKKQLANNLEQLGYNVQIIPSFISSKSQTNAIFTGKRVPVNALQEITQVLEKTDIPIKTIQTQIALRSGNPYEIQIGGSTRFNNADVIPKQQLKYVSRAKSFLDVKKIINKTTQPRLFIHCTRQCNKETLTSVKSSLSELGPSKKEIIIGDVIEIGENIPRNQLRYFHDEDLTVANSVLSSLRLSLPNLTVSLAKVDTPSHKQHFELWLAEN